MFPSLKPTFLLLALALSAGTLPLGAQVRTIRGEVWVEMEPIHGDRVDPEFPLSGETASRRALQEAALYFSAMIYGWSFRYEIGERTRGIDEDFGELLPLGEIRWGDPALSVTDVRYGDSRLGVWADYDLDEVQQRWLRTWRTGTIRGIRATGFSPLSGPAPDSDWLAIRYAALTDAARAALRDFLRANERNRPKEVSGMLCLVGFPRFYVSGGRLAAAADFRLRITEIVPFAAY